MNQEDMERLVNKSDRQLFINDLNTGFGLSIVEAEALYDRITLFNRDYYDGSRGSGQITKTAVALGEPAGKPIKYCRMVSVNLTIYHDEDLEDIGRGVSHKTRAVELFLKDYSLSEISRKMAHSPASVNRYLDDFLVVAFLHRESYPLLTIRKITKLSERLIMEYISLIERAEREEYGDRLNQLLDQFAVHVPFKKTLNGGAR